MYVSVEVRLKTADGEFHAYYLSYDSAIAPNEYLREGPSFMEGIDVIFMRGVSR